MKPVLLALGVTVAFAPLRAPGAEPDAKSEAWINVRTQQDGYRLRVDGGPQKQEAGPAPQQHEKWKRVPGANPGTYGFLSPDGKRLLYAEDDPETRGNGKKGEGFRSRIMIADATGKNPKQVLTGLKANLFSPSPDEKSVVCGAERDGKWDLYRVPFDGSKPVKLSQTSGLESPEFRCLSGDRVLYLPVTDYHSEPGPLNSVVTSRTGPVVLTDGTKETVLLKEVIGRLPEVTPDGTKMAHGHKNEKGEAVVEITELKTGKKEEVPLKAFNTAWKCEFGQLVFRPDGRALAVTFSLGSVVYRENGPLPGDEAVEHVGVIWFDGRKERTTLFRLAQAADKNGYYHDIRWLEWAAPAKK